MTIEYDDLTLEEYLVSLSAEDKQLVSEIPLDVDKLVSMDSDEFNELKLKTNTGNLTEDQELRKYEIIGKIGKLRTFAVLEREARDHSWPRGNNGGNGK